MGQSSGKNSLKAERRIDKNPNRRSDDDFVLDGYGSEKVEAKPLSEALKVSSNPAVAYARYHTEGSRQLADDYKIVGTVLGKGLTGEVVLARSKNDGHEYALKRFHKHQLSEEELKFLCREVQICLAVDHPGIARLHDVYDNKSDMYLVMECCRGGELFDKLEERGQYAEHDAADACLQMFRAINYLHNRNIVHRDIKLENFLYESRNDNAALKLIDFGFAKVWDPNTLMMARCGSIAYVSPDVLQGTGYTAKCDVWSLGVVAFMLLSGYPPFHGTDAQIRSKIKGAKPNFNHTSRWEAVSEEAKDFVRQLLEKDPAVRPTAGEALRHSWLRMNTLRACPNAKLNREVLKSLRRYMRSSKVQRTTLQLLAQELQPDETASLRDMFLQMDSNGKGTVSLTELKEAIRGVREGPTSPHGGWSMDNASSLMTPTMVRATSQTIAELFDVLDANGDEQVYYSDFLAAASQTRSKLRVETVRKVFNRLDVDKSGTISAADLYEAIGENFGDVTADDLLRETEITLDGRGEITFDAFVRMLERRDVVPAPRPPSATCSKCSGTFMKDSLEAATREPWTVLAL